MCIVEVKSYNYSIGAGMGIKIHNPDGKNYEHSFSLLFPNSNIVIEYEAAIYDLKIL